MEDRTNGDGSLTPSQTFRDVNWNPETIYTTVMITVKSGKLKESVESSRHNKMPYCIWNEARLAENLNPLKMPSIFPLTW